MLRPVDVDLLEDVCIVSCVDLAVIEGRFDLALFRGCFTFPLSGLVGVDGLDSFITPILCRVGVVTTVSFDAHFDEVVISLMGLGLDGFANVLLALRGPGSEHFLRIFFPGCISPEDLTPLVVIVPLDLLKTGPLSL